MQKLIRIVFLLSMTLQLQSSDNSTHDSQLLTQVVQGESSVRKLSKTMAYLSAQEEQLNIEKSIEKKNKKQHVQASSRGAVASEVVIFEPIRRGIVPSTQLGKKEKRIVVRDVDAARNQKHICFLCYKSVYGSLDNLLVDFLIKRNRLWVTENNQSRLNISKEYGLSLCYQLVQTACTCHQINGCFDDQAIADWVSVNCASDTGL